jgi:hypothetical protein
VWSAPARARPRSAVLPVAPGAHDGRDVFAYGWSDDRIGVGPGSTTVELDQVGENGVTTERLVHHGLPPAADADHARGWAYFLGVLRELLADPSGG